MPSLTPTRIAKSLGCPHYWYLECHGDPAEKVEPDVGALRRMAAGVEHEKAMLATLDEYSEPEWDGHDWDAGAAATIELMREGVEWIYQGVLVGEELRGLADFLHRVEEPSDLGLYSYIPIDAKNHKEVQAADTDQLASYARLLEPILGRRPKRGGVWLNTAEIEEVDLASLKSRLDQQVESMLRIRDGQEETAGLRCGECGTCGWIEHCDAKWEEEHNVCAVYGVSGDRARKLYDAGVQTWDELAAADPEELVTRLGGGLPTPQKRQLLARARVENRPIPIADAEWPSGGPIVHYDIETYGPTTYLHGLVLLDGERREERSFLARRPDEEAEAWHAFLEYMADLEGAIVWHWASYERGHVDSLRERHGGSDAGWRVLDSGMRDMCKFVKDHWALPVYSYGIKTVAPLFGFEWQAEDAGGLNSEVWYGEWLEDGDGEVLEKILEYNLDDVRAMEAIYDGLRDATP